MNTPLLKLFLLLLAAAFSCPGHAVLPDAEPKPKPKLQQPSPQTPQRSEFQLLGTWSVEHIEETGIAQTGTLVVDQTLGEGVYKGTLDTRYTNKEGQARRVKQGVLINVDGNKLTVNCSNPINIEGSGGYNADNFHLTIVNSRLIKGYNKDAKGIGGTVVLTR